MKTYCVICKKNTTNKNSSGRGTKNKKNTLMLVSNCVACGKKNGGSLGNCFNELRMKKFIIKFFLTGYNFMLELHLRQTGFTYWACGLYTKHHERI